LLGIGSSELRQSGRDERGCEYKSQSIVEPNLNVCAMYPSSIDSS
jgi:hypothetical protein